MPKRNTTIPLHRLEEHTDERFHLERVDLPKELADENRLTRLTAHRDDHYIFMMQNSGAFRVMVDFELYESKGRTILFVLPGQVHDFVDVSEDPVGWYLAIDAGLIADAFRAVFEDPLLLRQPLEMSEETMQPMINCLELIYALKKQPETVYLRQSIYSLLTGFIGMFADRFAGRCENMNGKVLRSRVITMEFRQLVAQKFRAMKSPGEYAEALHLSLSYLNEIVKETTGFPVSYWIQKEIMLEAKRLLYYSQCSVKEVAFELGYEDHTYFSRLFKKVEGKTPGDFRAEYRK